MEINYMIDIETLDTLDESLILSVAAVRFTQDEILDTLILYPDFEEQKGRTISIQTVTWWMTHSDELVKVMNENRKQAYFIYHQLLYFMHHDAEKQTIWAKSPSFDLNILKHYFRQYTPLWKYSQEADVRTAYLKLNQKNIPIIESTKPHDALEDALSQARNVMEFLKI